MASTAFTPLSISPSSTLIKGALPRQCVGLPATAYSQCVFTAGRKVGRNVAAMATTGEASTEVVTVGDAETPEILKKAQEAVRTQIN